MRCQKIAIILLMCLFFSGCAVKDAINLTPNDSGIAYKSDVNLRDYSSAVICDVTEHAYEPVLNVTLTSEDIQALADAFDGIELSNELVLQEPLYKICFKNGDDSVEWTVDDYRTIYVNTGGKFERTGKIDTVLTEIEDKNNISLDLFGRTPGKFYFSDLDQADHGTFFKFTENNFEDSMETDIDESLIENLKQNKNLLETGSEQNKDIDTLYYINFYDSYSNGLHVFKITESGKVYTGSGYEIKGDYITDFVKSVMDHVGISQ